VVDDDDDDVNDAETLAARDLDVSAAKVEKEEAAVFVDQARIPRCRIADKRRTNLDMCILISLSLSFWGSQDC
jgi:hypothetical protein